MSVAAFNKFALLNDDEDGSSPTLVPAKSKLTTVSKAPEPPAQEEKKSQAKGGPASRSGRYYTRGGAPKQSAPATDSNAADESGIPPARFDRTEGRPDRGRGRGRGEGGRGGKDRGAFNKDRHSRTAIVDSEKQVNQGWGAETGTAELANETQGEADAVAEATSPAVEGEADAAPSWGAEPDLETPAAEGDTSAEVEKPKPVAEEDNTMTLDEYLAKKTQTSLAELVPQVGPRQANEGAGEDLFKNAQRLEQAEEEAYFAVKTKSHKAKPKKEKDVVTIEIDGPFSDAGRGRGRGRGDREFRGGRGRGGGEGRGEGRGEYRGGRGGFRGGERHRDGGRGGRGGYGNRNTTPQVNVDDESAFPPMKSK